MLAHAGSCRNENQVGFIETGQRRVQRVEASGHTGNFTVRPGTLVEFGIQVGDDLSSAVDRPLISRPCRML